MFGSLNLTCFAYTNSELSSLLSKDISYQGWTPRSDSWSNYCNDLPGKRVKINFSGGHIGRLKMEQSGVDVEIDGIVYKNNNVRDGITEYTLDKDYNARDVEFYLIFHNDYLQQNTNGHIVLMGLHDSADLSGVSVDVKEQPKKRDPNDFVGLVTDGILDGIKIIGRYGIKIIKAAIPLLVLLLGANWLWRLVKRWLFSI